MSRKRILLVEYAGTMPELIAAALERYDVRSCKTDPEELRAAVEPPPDLILLELSLYERESNATYKWLRSNPGTAHVPIVVCTAHRANTLRRGLDEKPPHLLYKPFGIRELQELVGRLLPQ